MTRVSTTLVGLLFVFGGLFHLGVSTVALVEAVQSRQWPSTPGKILTSEVAFRPHSRPAYSAHVEYAYTVRGANHRGSSISIKDVSGDKALAEETIAPYTVGTEAPVYFNPSDPGRAVLEPDLSWTLAFWPVLSAIIVGIGSFLLVRAVRGRMRDDA